MGVEPDAEGWEIELRGDQGLLTGPECGLVELGGMINIGLWLSRGEWVDFDARVRAIRHEGGAVEACVEFTELSVAERQEFCRWQSLVRRRDGSTRLAVRVEPAEIVSAPSAWAQRSWRA